MLKAICNIRAVAVSPEKAAASGFSDSTAGTVQLFIRAGSNFDDTLLSPEVVEKLLSIGAAEDPVAKARAEATAAGERAKAAQTEAKHLESQARAAQDEAHRAESFKAKAAGPQKKG